MKSSPNQDPVRVRRRRVQAGLKQCDLAGQAGISQSYMSMLEAGTCSASPPVMARLAAVLGCEIAELMPPEPSTVGTPA
ncbi:helix-turn-helix transcriptional regulator [Streptomyces sp. NPDC051014]|uniref:helix-turn-helix domain-containing protein n=1 Tax=Streptomyces sp. NPDC051014 TaxID=3155751 RepID=UPI0034099382